MLHMLQSVDAVRVGIGRRCAGWIWEGGRAGVVLAAQQVYCGRQGICIMLPLLFMAVFVLRWCVCLAGGVA
jgi:hypothetical protein